MKVNAVLGVLGGMCGAALGAVLWIILGQIGFIAGLAGYAIVFLSVKAYVMFGGGISKGGLIACIIISVLAILAAEFASTAIAICVELKQTYEMSVQETIRYMPEFLTEGTIISGILKNLAVGYGLAVWASFSYVRSMWKRCQ